MNDPVITGQKCLVLREEGTPALNTDQIDVPHWPGLSRQRRNPQPACSPPGAPHAALPSALSGSSGTVFSVELASCGGVSIVHVAFRQDVALK